MEFDGYYYVSLCVIMHLWEHEAFVCDMDFVPTNKGRQDQLVQKKILFGLASIMK